MEFSFLSGPNFDAYLTLLVAAAMFVLFVREQYPVEVVAIGGVATLLLTGVLPYEVALGVLNNPAPWTIAAMFIVMGALVRTGALAAFTSFSEAKLETNPRLALAGLLGGVIVASAFVSNTPVVVVMIPVFPSTRRIRLLLESAK